ncbi:MAG: hypothetical protein QXL01_04730 [Thermoplasmatales archaeon]
MFMAKTGSSYVYNQDEECDEQCDSMVGFPKELPPTEPVKWDEFYE